MRLLRPGGLRLLLLLGPRREGRHGDVGNRDRAAGTAGRPAPARAPEEASASRGQRQGTARPSAISRRVRLGVRDRRVGQRAAVRRARAGRAPSPAGPSGRTRGRPGRGRRPEAPSGGARTESRRALRPPPARPPRAAPRIPAWPGAPPARSPGTGPTPGRARRRTAHGAAGSSRVRRVIVRPRAAPCGMRRLLGARASGGTPPCPRGTTPRRPPAPRTAGDRPRSPRPRPRSSG